MEPAKRRILFVITTSDWGGAQNFVFNMALEVRKSGFEVLVVTGEDGELTARCASAGLVVRRLRHLKRELSPLHDLAVIYELRRLIRQFNPDAIHLNSSKAGVVGSIAADLERVPRTIYRIGGWAFNENVNWLKKKIYLWSEKLTAAKKDIIICNNPSDEELARHLGIRPRHKLVTIPNGLNLASFDQELLPRDAARQKLGVSPSELIVGTIANFYPPKNIPNYLKLISNLSRNTKPETQTPNPRFLIIGDGPERELIQKLQHDLKLENRVLLTGRRHDARSLLRAFDIFVLPSSKEGMPWGLLEAMAAGLPCVATDVGACRWMLSPDAGIIVNPCDQQELIRAISELASDPDKRARLGQNARRVVEERFQWGAVVQKTLKLFE